MKLNIIILAAGEGKRMHSEIPKVLHTIGGMPMLERVVQTATKLKPDNIYVVYGNGGSKVKEPLERLPVTWVEQKQQLGTGHAVQQVMPHIDMHKDSRTLVLFGDVPLICPDLLQQLLDNTPKDSLGIITAILDNPFGLGRIIRDNTDNIIACVEQRDATEEQQLIQEINTGIMLAPTQELDKYLRQLKNNNAQSEYYLTDVMAMAAADNHHLTGTIAPDYMTVFGVNDKAQLAQVERYYQQQKATEFMQQGLILLDPARFDLRGELTFGKDVTIDANVIFIGKVELGDNVEIRSNCVIENAVIDNNCAIGPFARIRPGTHIKAGAHIGNFVELKKTEFGENSKAGHLTYLGDTIVGKDVNIGAGTITCNYDGVNKFQTVIEDGAFIGSNTQLVAPVTVGKNATIGAGSTITHDVPAEQLTLARAKQCSIPEWVHPAKKEKK